MSNFSVIKQQDSEGFVSNVKIAKTKIQTPDECFTCKKCKVEYRVDGVYVAYLKTKIEKYEKRSICQKCKNLLKVSKGETPVPLRPDQEWPANQQKPFVPIRIQTFADMAKKPVYRQPLFFPTKEVAKEEKMPSTGDEKAWPTLPLKPKEAKPAREKNHVHVVLTVAPGKSWADDENC